MRPHRQQPARLPHPWDSPGKNTGVGCHFLLQWMKVKIESEVAQSCPTLSDPMDCSLPGSSVHGSFQARALEWGAIAFSALNLDRAIDIYSCLRRGPHSVPPLWLCPPIPLPGMFFHFWSLTNSFQASLTFLATVISPLWSTSCTTYLWLNYSDLESSFSFSTAGIKLPFPLFPVSPTSSANHRGGGQQVLAAYMITTEGQNLKYTVISS